MKASLTGLSSLVAGEDGNAYAMFQADEPTVFVISSAGEIVRSFKVGPPSPGFVAIGMNWADGLGLLLQTAEMKKHTVWTSQMLFSVVDPQTGERLGDYQVGPQLCTGLACFTRERILFLASDKGKMVIRNAEIQ